MSHPIIEQLKRDIANIEGGYRAENILQLIQESIEGLDILGQAPLDPNEFPTHCDSLYDDLDIIIDDSEFELTSWDDDVVTAVQPYETMRELIFGS